MSSQISLAASLSQALRFWTGRDRAANLRRHQYKEVWNSVSATEDAAKLSVAGYVDEDDFARTAAETVATLGETTGLRTEDDVLEIGAGVGRVAPALAPLVRSWTGVDASDNMVAHMERRLAGLANVRVLATNGYDLSGVADASFDLVYCTVVFMHLDEWERYGYIAEGFRVLRPGGRMYVDNVNLLSDEGWRFFEEHRALPPSDRPAQVSRTSTPEELDAYFLRAGFEAVQQRCAGLWLSVFGRKPAE